MTVTALGVEKGSDRHLVSLQGRDEEQGVLDFYHVVVNGGGDDRRRGVRFDLQFVGVERFQGRIDRDLPVACFAVLPVLRDPAEFFRGQHRPDQVETRAVMRQAAGCLGSLTGGSSK